MDAYFEMLRSIRTSDLEKVDAGVAAVLKRLPQAGHVSAVKLEEEFGRDVALRALEWACKNGGLYKIAQDSRVMGLESVMFWLAQLNSPKMKRFHPKGGTRRAYADALEAFNSWLSGRRFPASRSSERKEVFGAFQNVEELLRFCEKSASGQQVARRVVREYLADLSPFEHSFSSATVRCSAIKSYFATHDVQVDVTVNKRRYAARDVQEPPGMSLFDFYKMMTVGSWDVMQKAIMMIKFHAGLDVGTMTDRFNFEAYSQIVRYFRIEEYGAWDLDRCPVPIRLVRVKTGMEYTTFIDRDAVLHLQDYLGWKEYQTGKKHDPAEPLFVTRRGVPVEPNWISARFSKAAIDAGIQKRVSRHVFKVHSHEVRDLLKSTLIASGCAPYAADHVLGHAPRDSYEKQATLYPEQLRAEYSKASGRLNMFTGIENYLRTVYTEKSGTQQKGDGGDRYQRMESRQQEMQKEIRRIAGSMADMLRIMDEKKNGEGEDV